MGNVNFGPDPIKTLYLRDQYLVRAFVETGTYKGATALWAAAHFQRVITIEGHEPRYRKTVAGLTDPPDNLKLVLGNSRSELAKTLKAIRQPALLWLDAHWCGDGAAEAHALGDECPLLEELAAVNASQYADRHVIMIDDARLFTASPPYPHDPAQWPTYAQLEAQLAPRHVYIENDVIYAEPVIS